MNFPEKLHLIKMRKPVNKWIDQVILENSDFFDEMASQILQILFKFENFFRESPWWLIIGLFFVFSFLFTHKLNTSIIATLSLAGIGALGYWDKGMQTLALMVICMIIVLVFGFVLGLVMGSYEVINQAVTPVLDLLQTMPSFVYLIPAIMLFGLGKVPAILATVFYAVPPLARLTCLGIKYVDKEIIEAAKAFGDSPRSIMLRIKIPLAMPSILGGVNQSIMMALAMVVVASLVGARGLGEPVLFGIQRLDVGMGLEGGLAITLMAIMFDRLTQGIGQRWIPPE